MVKGSEASARLDAEIGLDGGQRHHDRPHADAADGGQHDRYREAQPGDWRNRSAIRPCRRPVARRFMVTTNPAVTCLLLAFRAGRGQPTFEWMPLAAAVGAALWCWLSD